MSRVIRPRSVSFWALSAFALIGAVASRTARADVLTQDAEDRKDIKREVPAAAALMQQAEAAVTNKDLAQAATLFAQARTLAPRRALPARRHCEVLAAMGRKTEAVLACDQAKTFGGGPLEMRAIVTAYLSGSAQPTADDVAHAWFYASQVTRWLPTLPFGYSAVCEIAQRLGDSRLLRRCVADMVRVAPEHAETKRFLQATSGQVPWSFLIGFGLIALVCLATLAHAIRRSLRRPIQGPLRVVSLLVVGVGGFLALAAPVRAAEKLAPAQDDKPPTGDLGGIPIDDKNPEASVPAPNTPGMDPLKFGYIVQDLLARAEAAEKKNDQAAVVRYYRAVVKMVPDRSVGFSKLCGAYEKLGDRDRAIQACGLALTVPGVTVEDSAHFVRLVLGRPGPVSAKDRGFVNDVVEHLRQQPNTLLAAYHLQCELALRTEDVALLEACTAGLKAKAPNDPKTISFEWALAIQKQDRTEAVRLIEQAKKSGVFPEGTRQMEELTEAKLGGLHRWRKPLLLLGLLVVAAIGFVILIGGRRRPSVGTA